MPTLLTRHRRGLGALAVAVVLCAATLSIPAGAAAPTAYSTHPIAGYQNVIGCLTPHRCVVGGYNAHGQGDVVVVTNGVPGHVSLISASQDVYGISCPNASGCVALVRDKTDVGTELATINAAGVPGRGVTYPTPPGAALFRLSCVTLRNCTLAGNNLLTTPNGTEIATWNGAKLTFHRLPGLAKTTDTIIEGISCVSSTCDVVGYFNRGATNVGLSEIDHAGKAFALHTVAADSLYGVVCISASRCFADGFNPSGGVFVSLANGALVSSTSTHGVDLFGLVCTGTACVTDGQEDAQPPSTDFTWGAVLAVTNGVAAAPIAITAASKLYAIAGAGSTVAVLGATQKVNSIVGVGS